MIKLYICALLFHTLCSSKSCTQFCSFLFFIISQYTSFFSHIPPLKEKTENFKHLILTQHQAVKCVPIFSFWTTVYLIYKVFLHSIWQTDIHDPDQPSCESLLCEGEVFAACFRCQALLCFEHFDNSEECDCHGLNTQDPYLENFQVDGYDEILVQEHEKNCNENVHLSKSGSVKSKNKIVKELRNKGEPYLSEKSRKTMAGRKNLPFKKCDSYMCELKRLECNIITQEVMKKRTRRISMDWVLWPGKGKYIARHISTTP